MDAPLPARSPQGLSCSPIAFVGPSPPGCGRAAARIDRSATSAGQRTRTRHTEPGRTTQNQGAPHRWTEITRNSGWLPVGPAAAMRQSDDRGPSACSHRPGPHRLVCARRPRFTVSDEGGRKPVERVGDRAQSDQGQLLRETDRPGARRATTANVAGPSPRRRQGITSACRRSARSAS